MLIQSIAFPVSFLFLPLFLPLFAPSPSSPVFPVAMHDLRAFWAEPLLDRKWQEFLLDLAGSAQTGPSRQLHKVCLLAHFKSVLKAQLHYSWSACYLTFITDAEDAFPLAAEPHAGESCLNDVTRYNGGPCPGITSSFQSHWILLYFLKFTLFFYSL